MLLVDFATIQNDGTHLGDEEPYGGWWAYYRSEYIAMILEGGYGALGETKGPYPTRGWGTSQDEAIALLCALNTEENELSIPWENQWAYNTLLGYNDK